MLCLLAAALLSAERWLKKEEGGPSGRLGGGGGWVGLVGSAYIGLVGPFCVKSGKIIMISCTFPGFYLGFSFWGGRC